MRRVRGSFAAEPLASGIPQVGLALAAKASLEHRAGGGHHI
jgi:hypothetical protein